METTIKVIEGDEFNFNKPTFCYKCDKEIKADEPRGTIACILMGSMTDDNCINLKWEDYCRECVDKIRDLI